MTKHELQATLLAWFAAEQRDLPWRRDYKPYRVWVSEIMLQQTQMERGVAYFKRWMERFPDIRSVAEAHEDEILKYWEGLGYYSRARNLHKAAKRIVRDHSGVFPESYEDILALPGVGPYTAAAVASIAFGADMPVVDANVERVFARLFDLDQPVKETATKKILREKAEWLLPKGRAREFNQALMELGALVCRKKPDCAACPLTSACEARRLNITNHRPVPGKKTDLIFIEMASGVLVDSGRVFIQKRMPGDVWGGLWEFPGGVVEPGETPAQGIVREFREETGFAVASREKLTVIKHGYTRFRVTMHCFLLELGSGDVSALPVPALTAAEEYRWAAPEELRELAFPAGHRKLIDLLERDLRFAGLR